MLNFGVRHRRWLARVPGLPQFFDALLLTSICLFHRARVAAMQALETEALHIPGVRLKIHRFGGIEFVEGTGRELGHLHSHGLLDVPVGRPAADLFFAKGRVHPHHVFPRSKWVSFQIETIDDVPFALELLNLAVKSRSENVHHEAVAAMNNASCN